MRPRVALPSISLALALTTLAACSSTPASPAASPSPTPVTTPATLIPETPFAVPAGVRVTELDTRPVGLARVGDAVWAALPDAGDVLLPGGGRVAVGTLPLRLVATPAGVWVSLIGEGTVVRINPDTSEVDQRVRVGRDDSEPEGLAFDGTVVWIVDQAGEQLLPLDPESGEVGKGVSLGVGPRLVAVAPSGSLYVANYTAGSLTRFDGNEARSRNAGSCLTPQGLAVAGGLLWVACTVDDRVVGFDLTTLEPVVRLSGLSSPDAVVGQGDTVYVVGQRGPTVWTIDATKRRVVHELVLDDAGTTRENVAAALLDTRLVVSHPEAQRLYAVPLRLLRP